MDLGGIIQKIAVLAPPILLALTCHESAHGYVASRLGDPTARDQGRITLNPIKHLDLMGTLVFFATQMIGWAKPVPVNPLNFRNPRRDMMWVSVAGPAANILLAFASAMVLRMVIVPFAEATSYFARPVLYMLHASVQINIALAVFNILPIPPLDGSKILAGILPQSLAASYYRFEPYGFIIILLLVFTGLTGRIIVPVIQTVSRILLGF